MNEDGNKKVETDFLEKRSQGSGLVGQAPVTSAVSSHTDAQQWTNRQRASQWLSVLSPRQPGGDVLIISRSAKLNPSPGALSREWMKSPQKQVKAARAEAGTGVHRHQG